MINFKKIHLRIKHKLKNSEIKQSTVNAIVITLVVCLGLYLAVQLSKNFSDSVSTLKTQEITDTDSVSLKGYIFRNEKVYFANGQVADFLIDNGQRVGVGKHVANLYSPVSGGDISDIQLRLNAMTERIRLLENGITDAKKLSQSSQIFDEIDASYYALLSALEDENFSLADKEEKLFLDAVNSYMVATGRTQEAQSMVNSLKAEKADFVSQNLRPGASVNVEESCYFYTEYDGYEEIFDYSSVMELTPAELSSLTSAQKKDYSGAVGKQVFDSLWYICFPASDELCDMFANYASGEAPRTEYVASFVTNNNRDVNLKFEKVEYSDSANNSGFVVFSCTDMPDGFEFSRAQNVQIKLNSTTGYRVPTEAVFAEERKYFVYILNGNTVEKRRITIIGEGAGYYIVNTYEDDLNEGGDGQFPYLSVNELIITSGRNLYDGKLLK